MKAVMQKASSDRRRLSKKDRITSWMDTQRAKQRLHASSHAAAVLL